MNQPVIGVFGFVPSTVGAPGYATPGASLAPSWQEPSSDLYGATDSYAGQSAFPGYWGSMPSAWLPSTGYGQMPFAEALSQMLAVFLGMGAGQSAAHGYDPGIYNPRMFPPGTLNPGMIQVENPPFSPPPYQPPAQVHHPAPSPPYQPPAQVHNPAPAPRHQPHDEPHATRQAQANPPAHAAADLGSLPPLGNSPSPSELKKWVSQVYDQFPQFSQTYEKKLGLSKDQVMAFHYADMSRESGSDGKWLMDLETGQGGPGHAWGPFQAAVTNFKGGGYDKDILNQTGLPTPDMSQFKNPGVSTFTGMKRLLEGTELAIQELGPGRPAQDYLIGSVAHHNTGHIRDTVRNEDWQKSYGREITRLMGGYLDRGHMTDDKAYWTGEPL